MPAFERSAATATQVASSGSSTTLFSASKGARGRMIYNDSTAVLKIKFGSTAATADYSVQVASQGTFVFPAPMYDGRVDGIWASANGNAYCTEW